MYLFFNYRVVKKIFILKLYDAQFGSTKITYKAISISILIYCTIVYYEMTTSKEYNFNIKIFVTAYFKTAKLNINNTFVTAYSVLWIVTIILYKKIGKDNHSLFQLKIYLFLKKTFKFFFRNNFFFH